MKKILTEHLFLHRLREILPYHPGQANRLLTADAELIVDPLRPGGFLVLKTDSICEEIQSGLYTDPYTIGWMAVTACMSDLAAAGSSPDALLLLLNLPPEQDSNYTDTLLNGIAGACENYHCYIAGGDVNSSPTLSVSVSALAHLHGPAPLLRTGCSDGDLLYGSATSGTGSAYAFHRFFSRQNMAFQPVAALNESRVISNYASCCTDTSDGLIPSLANLMAVNPVGFEIDQALDQILSASAMETCLTQGIPSWCMLAGPHGDYTLLFTIPPAREEEFLASAAQQHWNPLRLGHANASGSLSFRDGNHKFGIDPFEIANLFHDCHQDPHTYFDTLVHLHPNLLSS